VSPFTRTACRMATTSNQPQRRGRPVVTPYSFPSSRSRSARSPSSSEGNGPFPTRVAYAFATPITSVILVGPIPTPVQAPPAPGRADAGALRSGFGEPLDRAVVGQDQVGREGHEEAAVHANPLLDQLFPLLTERVAIHDDAISNVAESVRAKDAGRDEMEDEGLIPHDDGVPGVRAALVACHHVGFLAQEIDDVLFSLVTPLGAYHDA